MSVCADERHFCALLCSGWVAATTALHYGWLVGLVYVLSALMWSGAIALCIMMILRVCFRPRAYFHSHPHSHAAGVAVGAGCYAMKTRLTHPLSAGENLSLQGG